MGHTSFGTSDHLPTLLMDVTQFLATSTKRYVWQIIQLREAGCVLTLVLKKFPLISNPNLPTTPDVVTVIVTDTSCP